MEEGEAMSLTLSNFPLVLCDFPASHRGQKDTHCLHDEAARTQRISDLEAFVRVLRTQAGNTLVTRGAAHVPGLITISVTYIDPNELAAELEAVVKMAWQAWMERA